MQPDDDRMIPAGDEEDLKLPDELIEGLARLDKSVAVMSPEADRRIAQAAKAHFEQRPRRARVAGRRWAVAGSLAASLLVGVLFWRTQTPVETTRFARVASIANDIDGSGVVDILDAFALARMERGDRAVQARIDALAMNIVALDGSAEKL
jgi:hypothetical protein